MKIYTEKNLRKFDFWSGAKDTVKYLTDEELDTIEAMLEDCAPADGYDETAINDFFWFEYEDFESLMNERDAARA